MNNNNRFEFSNDSSDRITTYLNISTPCTASQSVREMSNRDNVILSLSSLTYGVTKN